MAANLLFHCHLKPHGRKPPKGALDRSYRSIIAKVAYRAGERMVDERTGEIFDFRRKEGIIKDDSKVISRAGTFDRRDFWAKVNAHHKRVDACPMREVEIAVPYLLNAEQRASIAYQYAREIAEKYGVGVDVNGHAPRKVSDRDLEKNPEQFHVVDADTGERHNGNWHYHILLSACVINEDGSLGGKCKDLDPKDCLHAKPEKKPLPTEWLRPRLAQIINEHLEAAGFDERVDHRTLEEQGIEREPIQYEGRAARALLRRGETSTVRETVKARAREAAAEKVRLAEQYAALRTEIERTQQQLTHLQNLLRNQEQDPTKILESWTPRQKILDAVEKLEKRKQRQEGWFDYTQFSVAENISIASILVHRLLVWLGLGGMPDVVNAMLKLADAEEQVQNTQQQYQRKMAQLDKMQSTALVTIVRNQKKARAGLKLKMKRARALNEKYTEQLQSAEELMNVTEQLLASLQHSIDEIATAPMTSAPVPVDEKKENPRRRRIEIEEDDTTTGASGKSGKAGGMSSMSSMSSMPVAAIKQRISHLRSLRPDLLFKAQLRSQGSFNLQEEREAQVQSLNSLSMEVEGLQTRLTELTETSTVIGKLLRPIFDRTEEKQVSELLSQRRSELVAAKAALVKIEKEYRMAWTRFQAQHGERWHQKLKPELDALVKLLPVAEAREASEQKAKIQREALQEQLKREAYLRQQRKPQSVALKKQTIEDHLAAEAAMRRPEAPTPKSYPRPKF